MYSLYYSPGAASLVVHWLLIELGVPHQLNKLDLQAGQQKRPEYLALNPNGVVPTLVIDGKPMQEAAAMLLWLADRHADAGLAPAAHDPRWACCECANYASGAMEHQHHRTRTLYCFGHLV